MDNKDKPVFPLRGVDGCPIYGNEPVHPEILMGLTKREYFAAKALQGLLANPYPDLVENENMAIVAVQQADYLLNELAKNIDKPVNK